MASASRSSAGSANRPRARTPRPKSKVESIVTHCVYEIATGAWAVGDRLPTLRDARELWGVNHLTVLKAYHRLVDLGLVRNEPRAGFFVAEHEQAGVQSESRGLLEQAYASTARRFGEMSTLGCFRYLAAIAEARARAQPECAFVECTVHQAQAHAREVRDRLDFPCAAMTTAELEARDAPPPGVRVLLSTTFHRAEVTRKAKKLRLRAHCASIEFSPELGRQLAHAGDASTIFATSRELATNMARSARAFSGGSVRGRASTPGKVLGDVERVLSRGAAGIVVLSPSLWTVVETAGFRDMRVRPLEYRIVEDAWTGIVARLGVPLPLP